MTEAQYIALEGNIRELWKGALAENADLNIGFFNMMYDKTAQFTDQMMGAGARMHAWNGSVQYDEIDLTYSKQYRAEKFDTGIQISRDMMEDGEYKRAIPMILSNKAEAIQTTLNYDGGEFWNDAFSGSKYTTADGAALCSASHYIKSGGNVQSNTNALALTYDNLETILISMQEVENDRGDKMLIRGDKVIAGMKLARTCEQLFGKERFEAYSGDLTPNVYKDFSYSIHPLITGNKFFVVNKTRMMNGSGANFWLRRDPRVLERSGDAAKGDFDTEMLSWKNIGRWQLGATNFVWLAGSDPD